MAYGKMYGKKSESSMKKATATKSKSKAFKPHMMYSKAAKGVMAKTKAQHLALKAKGYTHTKPKKK